MEARGVLHVGEGTWHLRLVRWYFPDLWPRDLCSYFWTVVLVLLVTTYMGPLYLLIGKPATFLWRHSVVKRWKTEQNKRWKTLSAAKWIFLVPLIPFAAVVALLLVTGIGLYGGARWLKARLYREGRAPSSTKLSGLGLLWQFLVAKKHRVCPLIEVN